MKKQLTILFLFINLTLQATNYYVKTGGSDVANGLTDATAWATTSRVNTKWGDGTIIAGDNIYFRRGDTFTGYLTAGSSGNASNRITVGAYGSGANPIISGFTTVSGWTSQANGIYRKVVSAASASGNTTATPKMVTVNGVNTPMGKWPKTGYYNIDSHSGLTQITAGELSGQNWIGGNVYVRCRMSLLWGSTISGHSGSTITFGGVENIEDGSSFFVNNHLSALTLLGEWAYQSGTLYMYFGAANPDNYTVKIASLETGVNLSGRSYITIEDLTIEGFNNGTWTSGNSSYLTIDNCDIRLIGSHGIRFGNYTDNGGGGGNHNTITNNTVTDCNNLGIETAFWIEFTDATVTGNTVQDIGTFPGMGGNMYQSYMGIRCWSDNTLVQYNRVLNVGYHGISFYGNYSHVRNNYIDEFCMTKNDGGGIYMVYQNADLLTDATIEDNIVLNGGWIDPASYLPYGGGGSPGIYLDDRTAGILIDGNFIYNCYGDGIALHGTMDITVTNNISVGNGLDPYHAAQIKAYRDFAGEPAMDDLTLTGNQFISLNESDAANSQVIPYTMIFQAEGGASEIQGAIASIGNNYYAMPFFPNSENLVRVWNGSWGVVANWYNLAEWKSYIGGDASSNGYLATAVDTIIDVHVIYNDTTVAKTWTLSATLYDVANDDYSTSVTLQPWEGMVLFGEGTVTPEGGTEPEPPEPPTLGSGYIKNGGKFIRLGGKMIVL